MNKVLFLLHLNGCYCFLYPISALLTELKRVYFDLKLLYFLLIADVDLIVEKKAYYE